jgi:hypothetical protein
MEIVINVSEQSSISIIKVEGEIRFYCKSTYRLATLYDVTGLKMIPPESMP